MGNNLTIFASMPNYQVRNTQMSLFPIFATASLDARPPQHIGIVSFIRPKRNMSRPAVSAKRLSNEALGCGPLL